MPRSGSPSAREMHPGVARARAVKRRIAEGAMPTTASFMDTFKSVTAFCAGPSGPATFAY